MTVQVNAFLFGNLLLNFPRDMNRCKGSLQYLNIILTCVSTLFILVGCSNDSKRQTSIAAGFSDEEQHHLREKYHLQNIRLPDGFNIDIFAMAEGVRSLSISPAGTVYAGSRSSGNVYAFKDIDVDGRADSVYTIASGLNSPNGVAFRNGNLFIATISEILRLDDIEQHLSNPPSAKVVFDKFPDDTHHGWKFIAFGPDGKLYVPVGAPCNICEPTDPVYASLTRMNEDGTGFEIFAKGIRNTVGFTWHPETNHLWFTDNGRDQLGDDVPNDELNGAPQAGLHFGYPYCHQGNIPDPEFGKGKDCSNFIPPVKLLGPHVAALGLRFNTGQMFPPAYRNALFISRHGSWNRSTPVGYDVVVLKEGEDGRLSDPQLFAAGWLQEGKTVNGRPVDIAFYPDGAMLVSDDYNGIIYRISTNIIQ